MSPDYDFERRQYCEDSLQFYEIFASEPLSVLGRRFLIVIHAVLMAKDIKTVTVAYPI
jgi:hypothetical protein